MSEKNTSSILETIKKKLHKLDKKSENNDQPTQIDDEFQYISSADQVAKESLVAKNIPSPISPNFDDLDLDDEDSIVAKAPSQQYQQDIASQSSIADNEIDGLEKPSSDWLNDKKELENSFDLDEDKDSSFLEEESLEAEDEDVELESFEEKNSQFEQEKKSFDEIFESSNQSNSQSSESLEDFDLKELGLSEEDFSNQKLENLPQQNAAKDSFLNDDLEIEALLDEYKNNDKQHSSEEGLDDGEKLDSKNESVDISTNDTEDFDILEAELKGEMDVHFDKVEIDKNSLISDEELQEDDFLKEVELPNESQNLDSDLNSNSNQSAKSKLESELELELESELELELESESSDIQNSPSAIDELESLDSAESFLESDIEKKIEEKDSLDVENGDKFADSAIDSQESELNFDDELDDDLLNSENLDLELEAQKQENENKMKQKIEVIPTQKSNQSAVSGLVVDSISVNSNRVLKEETVRQVSDSVKKLVDAKNVVAGVASFSQSPALGEIAAHLMEPKIDKWFNENLPELVEKIVREEIKKLIPRD